MEVPLQQLITYSAALSKKKTLAGGLLVELDLDHLGHLVELPLLVLDDGQHAAARGVQRVVDLLLVHVLDMDLPRSEAKSRKIYVLNQKII